MRWCCFGVEVVLLWSLDAGSGRRRRGSGAVLVRRCWCGGGAVLVRRWRGALCVDAGAVLVRRWRGALCGLRRCWCGAGAAVLGRWRSAGAASRRGGCGGAGAVDGGVCGCWCLRLLEKLIWDFGDSRFTNGNWGNT
nr:hypothetical protein Itr_chr06CG10050 [Ipomoea trifida]